MRGVECHRQRSWALLARGRRCPSLPERPRPVHFQPAEMSASPERPQRTLPSVVTLKTMLRHLGVPSSVRTKDVEDGLLSSVREAHRVRAGIYFDTPEFRQEVDKTIESLGITLERPTYTIAQLLKSMGVKTDANLKKMSSRMRKSALTKFSVKQRWMDTEEVRAALRSLVQTEELLGWVVKKKAAPKKGGKGKEGECEGVEQASPRPPSAKL